MVDEISTDRNARGMFAKDFQWGDGETAGAAKGIDLAADSCSTGWVIADLSDGGTGASLDAGWVTNRCVAGTGRAALPDKRASLIAEGWRPARFLAIVVLLNRVAESRRWHWRKLVRHKKAALQLVDGGGRVWDFKLNGGAWIRPAKNGEDEKHATEE